MHIPLVCSFSAFNSLPNSRFMLEIKGILFHFSASARVCNLKLLGTQTVPFSLTPAQQIQGVATAVLSQCAEPGLGNCRIWGTLDLPTLANHVLWLRPNTFSHIMALHGHAWALQVGPMHWRADNYTAGSQQTVAKLEREFRDTEDNEMGFMCVHSCVWKSLQANLY